MYLLKVKLDGIEKRKRSTGVLHLAVGFLLVVEGSLYFQEKGTDALFPMLGVWMVALLSLLYGFFRNKLDATARFNHWLRMLQFLSVALLGILMINIDKEIRALALLLFAIIILLLLFTERKIFHDTDVRLTAEGIFIPGYFTNHRLPWHVIEDMVIREDFVTIFRRDQKYVQLELLQFVETGTRTEITSFCREQINKKQIITT